MAYQLVYPQPTGYIAAPSASYYYVHPPAHAQYVHNPQYSAFLASQDQRTVSESATAIQRFARSATQRIASGIDPPKTGTVMVKVHSASNLRNANCCCSMTVYAMAVYGDATHKFKKAHTGGQYPEFDEKERAAAFPFQPDVVNLKVELLASGFFCDSDLGHVLIPTEDLWKGMSKQPEPREYQLEGRGGGQARVTLTAFYVPPLILTIHRCKELPDVQLVGKQDPYVRIAVPGAVSRSEQRTSVSRDGDRNPRWEGAGATHAFLLRHPWHLQKPRTDEEAKSGAEEPAGPSIVFECINQNALKDAHISHARIPFELVLKTFRRGPVWTAMVKGSSKGKKNKAGGFIAWSVSGGPGVTAELLEDAENAGNDWSSVRGMQPMPDGPVAQDVPPTHFQPHYGHPPVNLQQSSSQQAYGGRA